MIRTLIQTIGKSPAASLVQRTGSWLVPACLLAIASIASTATARDVNTMNEREIDKALAVVIAKGRQFQELARLKSIGSRVARSAACQPLHAKAAQTFRQLNALNEQFAGGANRQYRQQEEQLRQANAVASRDYRVCFTEALKAPSLRWPEKKVVDYPSFYQRFSSLAVQLRGESADALKKRANELYAAKQRYASVSKFPFASLARYQGEVSIDRRERSIRLATGINVLAGDTITTSANGRLAVEFTEVVGKVRRGPYRIWIGPSSRVRIGWQTNMVVQDRKKEAITLELHVDYGAVRVAAVGAGFDSNYKLIAGQTSTQLLGGDTVVSHYPKRKLANTKLRAGTSEVVLGSGKPVRLKPNQQVSTIRGEMRRVGDLPDKQWQAALVAAGSADRSNTRRRVNRPGDQATASQSKIRRRARARLAVDAMLIALRGANANDLLTSTSGEAQRNARNSMRRQSLRDVLRSSGRPITWFHDCVVCSPDGYCAVPTEVKLEGGPSRKYDALHIVKPTRDDKAYTVDRIAPWDEAAQARFRRNTPLCEANLPNR